MPFDSGVEGAPLNNPRMNYAEKSSKQCGSDLDISILNFT
jgi:hypothetical protein